MSFVSDFFDDTLGLDPSGGGLHSIEGDVFNYLDPVGLTLNIADNGFNLGSWNAADDVMGFDPNGGGAVQTANAVAPLVAAYFTGAYGGDLLGGAWSTGTAMANSSAINAALMEAGMTPAEAASFGSALADSWWGSYLTPSGSGIMGDVSTSGLFGPTTSATGLGDIYGTTNGLGSLIGGIGEASPTVLGNTVSGMGGILGTADGASSGSLTDLLNTKNVSNLAKAWKAFTSQGSGGQKSPNEVTGFLNTLQTMALMGQALKGSNGIGPNSLKTHDLVAPKGPDFAKATQNRMSRKFKRGGGIPGGLGQVSSQMTSSPRNPGGQDDVVDIKAAPGEYVFDADTVAALGDGNTETGARKLDEMRYNIRKHKRSAPPDSIPPRARPAQKYLKGN